MVSGSPTDVCLHAFHPCVAGVHDGRDSALALYRGLYVLPLLVENGSIDAQPAVEPRSLPTELEIRQRIRPEGAGRWPAVIAAGPEAGGPCSIDHGIRSELIGQVDLVGFAVLDDLLLGIHAGHVAP